MIFARARVDARPTRFGRLSREHAGSILVITAVTMTVVLGITALSIDAAYMYDKRNRLYAAADAAAKAAAIEMRRDGTLGNSALTLFANQQINAHGFNAGVTTNVDVHRCTDPGATCSAGLRTANYVEVLVSETTPTFFGRLVGWASLTPGARAVAGSSPGPDCVITLSKDNPSGVVIGSSVVSMPGCNLDDNGYLQSSGTITAREVNVSQTCSGTCTGVNQHTAYVGDPLASVGPPADPGCNVTFPTWCTVRQNVSGTVTLDPGKYAGWSMSSGATLHLRPGLYYITGAITSGSHVTIDGSNVLIFLDTGASIDWDDNGITVTLSAQTGGTYNGILFYQRRGNSLPAILGKNNEELNLTGAMYFPDAAVTTAKNNGGLSNDCTLFVAATIDLKNNAAFSNGCAAYGGSPIMTASLAE